MSLLNSETYIYLASETFLYEIPNALLQTNHLPIIKNALFFLLFYRSTLEQPPKHFSMSIKFGYSYVAFYF